jgi:hypothetical protein
MPLTYTLMSESTCEGAVGRRVSGVVVGGSIVVSPVMPWNGIRVELIARIYNTYFALNASVFWVRLWQSYLYA